MAAEIGLRSASQPKPVPAWFRHTVGRSTWSRRSLSVSSRVAAGSSTSTSCTSATSGASGGGGSRCAARFSCRLAPMAASTHVKVAKTSAHRGLLSAPDHAPGCPKLRSASANQPVGPRPTSHTGHMFDIGIHAIEERWNGAPLLWWAPFRWVRRANGVLSSLVTPRLAR